MAGPRSIVLTGASSGIGAALAAELAAPGRSLLLIGRNEDRLRAAAATAEAKGAEVATAVACVTDHDRMAAVLLARDADRPVDLLIANAGVTSGRSDEGPEPPGQARWIVEINLAGVFNTVEPLLPAMIARGSGQIVLVGSMAALWPQADEPSYSASKAGVRAYGIALRAWLRAHGIAVTVVTPGYVTSPMSERHRGPKPFEMPADRAARIIARAISGRRAELVFPWQFGLMVRLGRVLPPALADRMERRLAARILPDPARLRDNDGDGG